MVDALTKADEIVEQQLDAYASDIEHILDGDIFSICGPLVYGVEDHILDVIESISPKKHKLIVVLETPGGYIEVAERISAMFRKHYHLVDFIIPNFAMSAGTILVMSGDAIYMDYFSVLGPIDPQVARPDGSMIPALGYLMQFQRLIEKSKNGQLTTAELNFLVEKFDPAELYLYEQSRELSISLLKEWLVKYKFKNWKVTSTRQLPVTDQMRLGRAEEIAMSLNETDRWHSHGRGISMDSLKRDLKLEIEDFASDPDLNEKIRAYYKLSIAYMRSRGHIAFLHTRGRYAPLPG